MPDSRDRKKLEWQCRRGTRELDCMTRYYLDHHYSDASIEEQNAFRKLLELPNPLLHSLLLGETGDTDFATGKIVRLIREHYDRRIT